MSAVVIPFPARRAGVPPAADFDWLKVQSMLRVRALFASATPAPPDVLDEILAALERIEIRLNA